MNNLYPAQPQIADYSFLNPSKSFAITVTNVLLAIGLFFITYLVLVLLALGLLYISLIGGIGILSVKLSGITFALGCGIMGLGLIFT